MPFHSKKKRLLFFIVPVLSGLIFYSFPLNTEAQTATTSLSVVISVCGNGSLEVGEDCDGTELGGQTCVGLGYKGGALSCSGCTFNTSLCSSGGPPGSAGWIPPVKETKVVLQGRAYPEAPITVLVDGEIVTIIKADSQANFRIELTTLTAGIYNFGLRAEDEKGRESITFSFSVTISHKMTTSISGLFIPPTIELDKTFLNKEEFLNISGQTAPQSGVNIEIESSEGMIVKRTKADDKGNWVYSFDTSGLKKNLYIVKVNSVSPDNLTSGFSTILKFGIGIRIEEVCPGADLNKDGRVDLVDFSILLYWWKKDNACADQNQDGIVDLQDFSIMMYYWTG